MPKLLANDPYLKSNMDRFIDKDGKKKYKSITDLKSNMDRFIGKIDFLILCKFISI